MRRVLGVLVGLGGLTLLLMPALAHAQSGSPTQPGDVSRGRALFITSCASCHGVTGEGTDNGINLHFVGGPADVDWVLRTGRMPLNQPGEKPERGQPSFSPEDIKAIVDYTVTFIPGVGVPTVDASQGDLVNGRKLFSENCAACHGMTGTGSSVGGGFEAPTLREVSPLDVAEAMRVGPGRMPQFSESELSAGDVNSIARYVQSLRDYRSPGGAPIGGKGPVPEGFVAWIIGLGVLVVAARLIGGSR